LIWNLLFSKRVKNRYCFTWHFKNFNNKINLIIKILVNVISTIWKISLIYVNDQVWEDYIRKIQTKEFKLIIENKWRRIFKINFITLEKHRNIQSKNNRFSKYTSRYRIYASHSIYQQDVLNLSWYLHRTFCMIKTYLSK